VPGSLHRTITPRAPGFVRSAPVAHNQTYAIQIWAEAANKAHTSDAQKVAQELKAGGPWQSVLGPISFDKKGDITTSNYVFYIWRNGNYAQM
jgi:branched-chain amino acid transport system substrate-binding protein